MTFYDSEMVVPGLPRYEDVLIDSPSCHQSLKFWSQKADQIAPVLSELASNVEKYHGTGVKHQKSGLNISEALSNVVKVFQDDEKISEPIAKFTDVLQRIECYRDMFLNQTQLLMWEPLVKLTQDYDKAKELNAEVLKAREAMHVAWEKFSSCPHVENLQEVGLLDKLAHSLLNARQNYQKVLLQYVTTLKEIHTLKKVVVLQKVLEHMLAQFSFFNFGYQTLKDIEPYMNGLFQELQENHTKVEESLKKEVETQQEMEKEVILAQQRDGQGFAEPTPAGIGQSVTSMNTQAGKIFNRIGDLFQAGSFGLAGSRKSVVKGSSSSSDQEWEVIESQRSSSKEKLSSEELSDKPSSSSSTPERRPKRIHDAGVKPSPKKDHHATGKGEEAKGTDQVIDVVPPELISPTTGNKETLSDNLLPAPIASLQPPTQPSLNTYKGFKSGYLRIRQKAFPKNKWPLLYFIVDKENGNLLAQGQEQTQPSNLENLLLCTVKICDSTDADRNFCFQLISTTSERVFQALTDLEVQEWVTALQEATADALRNSKAKLKTLARSNLSDNIGYKREPRSLVLNAAERIRKVAGNKYCADCSCPRPDWASINIGITICIECSGVHRNMGVHVSKVRSLTLDKWEDTTVEFMEAMGNTKSNQMYEGNLGDFPKPTRDSSKEERKKFIQLKYVEQRFYKALPSEELDPEIAKVMASRPGESEEDLFDVSGEECPKGSCTEKTHSCPQLVMSDSGEDDGIEEEDNPESNC